MNTPVFPALEPVLSSSLLLLHSFIYFSTSSFCDSVVISLTSGCSGDNTVYVAPNNVSHLVVNTVKS